MSCRFLQVVVATLALVTHVFACGSSDSSVLSTGLPSESPTEAVEPTESFGCEACLASGRTWQPGADECTDDCDIMDAACFRDVCPEPCGPDNCGACYSGAECQAASCQWQQSGEAMWCTERPSDGYHPITFAGATATADERAECESAGGIVRPGGLAQSEICEQHLPDAGQTCSSASNCLGRCVLLGSDIPPRGTAATGTCEATDVVFGCITLVENGAVEGTLCVD